MPERKDSGTNTLDPETNKRVEDLKTSIREDAELPTTIYTCMANICQLLRAFRKSDGKPGWSAMLLDGNDEPMLELEDQQKLEEAFANAPWLRKLLNMPMPKGQKAQKGGQLDLPKIAPGDPKFLSDMKESGGWKGTDLSFQSFIEKGIQKTQSLDEFWSNFARNTTGATKFLDSDQIFTIPWNPPIIIPISRRFITLVLTTMIDSLRTAGALTGQKNTFLTVLILLEELITGQWRQMLMTAIGLFSPTGVAISVIFKYIINAWLLIPSQTRDNILYDVFDAGQGFFMGFLLWAAATLPPNVVKLPIEAAFASWNAIIDKLEGDIHRLEAKANEQLRVAGKEIKFSKLDLTAIKGINFSTISNLQNVLKWPLLVCNEEFKAIMDALNNEPILYLLVEMMGAPTTDQKRFRICGTTTMRPLGDVVAETLTPDIVDAEGTEESAPEGQAPVVNQPTNAAPEAEAPVVNKPNAPPSVSEAEAPVVNKPTSGGGKQKKQERRLTRRKSKREKTKHRSPRSRRRDDART